MEHHGHLILQDYTARYRLAGFGTQTAAVAVVEQCPGSGQTATESYNGTSWTSTQQD
jgi:hypothetical protein